VTSQPAALNGRLWDTDVAAQTSPFGSMTERPIRSEPIFESAPLFSTEAVDRGAWNQSGVDALIQSCNHRKTRSINDQGAAPHRRSFTRVLESHCVLGLESLGTIGSSVWFPPNGCRSRRNQKLIVSNLSLRNTPWVDLRVFWRACPHLLLVGRLDPSRRSVVWFARTGHLKSRLGCL